MKQWGVLIIEKRTIASIKTLMSSPDDEKIPTAFERDNRGRNSFKDLLFILVSDWYTAIIWKTDVRPFYAIRSKTYSYGLSNKSVYAKTFSYELSAGKLPLGQVP